MATWIVSQIALTKILKTHRLKVSRCYSGIPAMEKTNLSINLLNVREKTLTDQILEWALVIGRLLVILTETLALTVFAARFSLDRQLIDLSDEIKKNQAMVSYFKTSEESFRKIQQKIKISKADQGISANTIKIFQDLMRKNGNEISFKNISVSPTNITIIVQAPSVIAVDNFTQILKENKQISSLSIDKIENRTTDAVVIVTMTGQLQGKL